MVTTLLTRSAPVHRRLVIGGAVVILLAAAVAWRTRPLAVAIAHAGRGPAVDAIYATGTVEPTVMLPIAPRSGGVLAALAVDEGASVRKGQMLARLDDADLARSVDELKARERYARADFERKRGLVAQHLLPADELDRARSDLDAAVASLRRASALRGYAMLLAPADGLVIRRDGEVGQFIPAGQAVLTLSCCAPLRVTADVDEEDIARIALGQAVVLRSDALPGKVYDGKVSEITPKGDPVARSYRVRIALSDPADFRIGMTADANIVVARRDNAVLIPVAALHGDSVWTLQDGRLHRQPVQVGVAGTDRVEITGGLQDGAELVLAPDEALREGRRARADAR